MIEGIDDRPSAPYFLVVSRTVIVLKQGRSYVVSPEIKRAATAASISLK